jgi:putative Ca2+/H+ antiporter (TMEM165/GDT1 family)
LIGDRAKSRDRGSSIKTRIRRGSPRAQRPKRASTREPIRAGRQPVGRARRRSGMLSRLEAFIVSAGVVALAEIGDKTQLLALVLAARFQRPLPIVAGILVATLVNHALAGAVGAAVAAAVGHAAMRWILGLSFVAMAVWTMIPDKIDESRDTTPRFGVFGTTVIAFFLLEIGDKTQIATVALAAKYASLAAVVAGTTCGMLLANVPAVLLGEVAARKLPMRLVHGIAAAIFLLLGVAVLLGVGNFF